MNSYLLKRLGRGAVTLFISVTITFFLIRLMPADPVSLMVDPKMGEDAQQALIQNLGLDRPLYEQYFIFIKNLFIGDLGFSFKTRETVLVVLMQKLPWTLLLLGEVVVITMLVGIPVGIFAARKKGKAADRLISSFITLGISTFIPFLSFVLLYLFSYLLKMLPTGGAYTPPPVQGAAYILNILKHTVLPAMVLFIVNVAGIVLYTRNSMVDVLKEDYIRTAYAKGLDEGSVIKVHALKNSLIPTLTVAGLMIGQMFGGAIMTETIFSWPGVGRLIYDSVSAMDYPVLQGAFLVLAAGVVLMNILTDLIIAWIDPRIKFG